MKEEIILERIDIAIANRLTSLDISNQNITNNDLELIFPLILSIPNLENINLSHNKLTKIPKDLINLDSIKSLNLANNQITAIDETIAKNVQVNLDANPLSNKIYCRSCT